MEEPVVFLPNGVEAARAKLQPIIEKMLDDERTGTDLMRAYFHVYLSVRFIGQTNQLIAVFRDLLEDGCEYRDVHAGMVEAHKALCRSPRWINVLKDMQPDHVVVQDRDDEEGDRVVYAIVRPPRNACRLHERPSTHITKSAPEEPSEPATAVTNGSSVTDFLSK